MAFLTSFFYTISWTHFYELIWIGATFNSIGVFFILTYLLFSLSDSKNAIHKFTEAILIFSLLSLETAVIAPLLLLLILFFQKQLSPKKIFRIFFHFAIVGFYLLYRFVIFRIPAEGTYTVGLSTQTIKNLITFFLWLFNFPEASIVHLRPNHYLLTIVDSWFAETFQTYSVFLTSSVIFWAFFFIWTIFTNLKKLKNILYFSTFWFLIGIIPTIVIPKRAYPYYPIVSQIGLWIFLSYLITKTKNRVMNFLALAFFIVGTIWAIRFNFDNHWIFASSGSASDYYQKYIKIEKAIVDKREIYWQIDDLASQNALLNGLAFNVFSDNYSQKFYLNENRFQNLPLNRKIEILNLRAYLAQDRSDRLERYFKLNISTPAASLDFWYQE